MHTSLPGRTLRPLLAHVLVVGLVVAASDRASRASDVPEPRFDGVDHGRPEAHLALSPEVGDAEKIRALARQLAADTPRGTLAAVSQWMHRNLQIDEGAAYRWRTMDQMLADRTYGGCADHAVLFGTLARAAGIPTIWVKTMDVAWIEDFRAGRKEAERYRGHVFLEVHVDGAWRLLDAQEMLLWEGYDPAARILPGHRFAYDKGDDPFTLVLSCRWEAWKEQTDRYFRTLDPALLPWSAPTDLLVRWRVHVSGNTPIYRYAAEACRRLGFHVESTFNTDWDRQLDRVRGRTLIVTCDGRRPVLPETLWAAWLPPGYADIVGGGPLPAEGYLEHRLGDGTRVVLVPGQDVTSVQVGVARALR